MARIRDSVTVRVGSTMESVDFSPGLPRSFETARMALPRGTGLTDDAWRSRHRGVSAILVAHIPAVFAVATVIDGDLRRALAGAAIVAVLALIAGRAPSRFVAMAVAGTGMVTCSMVLIIVSGGHPAAHLHLLVAVGVIALYQSWAALLSGVATVILGLSATAIGSPQPLYDPMGPMPDWTWVAIDGAFVLFACALHLSFWSLQEKAHNRAEEYYRRLYEGEQAVSDHLRATQMMKDDLVATVSHEFRTPLTCILGFARTLRDHPEDVAPEMRADFVDRIVQHGERLHRLVENLLVTAQVSSPVPDASSEVRPQLLAVTSALASSGRPVRTTVERGDLRVRMGRESLYHVLFNVVENGSKFSRPGTDPRVAVWQEGDEVVVEVANQGSTIDAQDRERIFEPFVQVDSSTTRAAPGLGMGLAVVRGLVEGHGGRVGVRSDPRETVFWLRIPAAPSSSYAPRPCTRPRPASMSATSSTGG